MQHEEYFCNVQNRDGLVGVAFVDKDYPTRAAFSIVAKILDDFVDQSSDRWRNATADSDEASSLLKGALTRYQVCLPENQYAGSAIREALYRLAHRQSRQILVVWTVCTELVSLSGL